MCFFQASTDLLAEEIVVAVQKNSVPTTPIKRYVMSTIFAMGMTTWPDGSSIRVFVLADNNPTHSNFCKQVLNVFPHQLRAAWDRLVFSGTGQSPVVVSSENEMRERLATTPGAIGYLPKETVNDSVAILPVE